VAAHLKPVQALALALAQGPAELFPVSSSAHTTLIPHLLGWPYEQLEPELRKSFEVALHAGAGAALALEMRAELAAAARAAGPERAAMVALSAAPPAVVGFALERFISRSLAEPRRIAAGLAAGAVAMAIADSRAPRAPRGAHPSGRRQAGRSREDLRASDAFALGLGQAAALIPGVSRRGATLAVARARGFARAEADALSWHAALPVIAGASALRGVRLLRRTRAGIPEWAQAGGRAGGAPPGTAQLLAIGAAGAFASTLASARLLRRARLAERPLLPYCAYRLLLAAAVERRARAGRRAAASPSAGRGAVGSRRREHRPWAVSAQ
jgi:undecaprenyl-diphosphatase